MGSHSTAAGKVILLGEHAVVFGAPAIAAGIERGARAVASVAPRSLLRFAGTLVGPEDQSDLGRAFRALLASLEAPPCDVEVELDIPAGCGLGASAAMGVAVARAVRRLATGSGTGPAKDSELHSSELETVSRAALEWERVFHGNPSGIDTTAALLGGCIFYTRDAGATPLRVPQALDLVVAIAGPAAPTKSMVDAVAKQKARRPDIVQKTIDGITALVRNARLCIEAGDLVGLGKLMDLNQMLLSGIFVSTEGIEAACRTAREAGALGAKLTGAGGGGAVIALSNGDPMPILRAWQHAGLEAFTTRISALAGTAPSDRQASHSHGGT